MIKTCDLCGESGHAYTEVFAHLASRDVKIVCYTCADIIGRYCDDVAKYATAREKALISQLQAQVDKQRKEQIRSKGHWLAIHLRSWFQRRGLHKGFEIGVKHVEPEAPEAPSNDHKALKSRAFELKTLREQAIDVLHCTLNGRKFVALQQGESNRVTVSKPFAVSCMDVNKLEAADLPKRLVDMLGTGDPKDVLVIQVWPTAESGSDETVLWMDAAWAAPYLVGRYYKEEQLSTFSCRCPA